MTGKIIKVSPKGYGFISSIEMPFTRIFFHWQALEQSTLHFTELRRGMRVEFEPVNPDPLDKAGWKAIKVSVINDDLIDMKEADVERIK